MKRARVMAGSVLVLVPWFVRAETWIDSTTGITWTYEVNEGAVTIGNGNQPAIDTSTKGALSIPSQIADMPVTSIGNSAFYYCSGLTRVTIPSGVTSIGVGAFAVCSGLASVTIPSSVANIGVLAFCGCNGLNAIVVDAENPYYASVDGVLYNKANTELLACSGGKTAVTIPSSVTSIGDWAFYECSGLKSVTIPSSVTNIGDYAFSDCSALTSVTIPSSVTSIGDMAFYDCDKLTSVTIPASVTRIGDYAFEDCSGLTSVTISEGVTSTGNATFHRCSKLTSVAIPSSVTNIGNSAFSRCSALTRVTISEGVTSIGNSAFYLCSALTSILFKGDAPSVGSYAFRNVNPNCVAYVGQNSTGWGVTIPGTWEGLSIQYAANDPIPDLGENPTSEQIAAALEGAADAQLQACITNAATYSNFRAWAETVADADGTEAAGLQAVQDSATAWVSFALDSPALLAAPIEEEDLHIEAFQPAAEAGKYAFTVAIDGVEVGSDAQKENLKRVLGLEGATTLDAAAFSSDSVDISFGTPVDGKVKFTAGPKNTQANTFFMKMKLQ